jgi:hypothetical protein
VTTPYSPLNQAANSPRWLYRSAAQVTRLTPTLQSDGTMSIAWNVLDVVLDPYLDTPGVIMCRLDLTFVRPGKDQPPPVAAGRAPDRIGVLYYDPLVDENNVPLLLAGDRLVMVTHPMYQTLPIVGTFEIRAIPDMAQDYVGAHHAEVQVIEVSQALTYPSPTTFPGGAP